MGPPDEHFGPLFRSEKMTLCQLIIQNDAAYACLEELGYLSLVQFKDVRGALLL